MESHLKTKVAVMLAGTSPERDISIDSGNAVAHALEGAGYAVTKCTVNGDDLKSLGSASYDCVFIALHGGFGEGGGMQALLEEARIPYTGSGPEASRCAMDKVLTKERFLDAHIPTPRFLNISREHQPMEIEVFLAHVGMPVAVKPAGSGSSIGVEIVYDHQRVFEAVKEALQYSDEALIEEYIRGRELTLGVLHDQNLPIVEIIPRGKFFDKECKYNKGLTEYITRPLISPALEEEVNDAAARAYRALGCRDYARVDLMLNSEGPFILEINTIPGFTDTSLLPMAARAAEIEFPELCSRIVRMAIERKRPSAGGRRKRMHAER